jgi:hypothetical protein
MRRYMLNILLWLDIGCNVLLFGGSPYETMSSRAGRQEAKGVMWACRVCAVLSMLLGPHHCKNSEVPDYGDTIKRG